MTNNVSKIVIPIIGLMVVLVVLFSERNIGSDAFKYIGGTCVCYALIRPKHGVYLLLIQTAFLDVMKRILFLTGDFGSLDLYLILGLAPATMLGVTIGATLYQIKAQQFSKGDAYRLLVTVMVFSFLVVYALGAGARGASQTGIAGVANASAYAPMIFVLPILFKEIHEIRNLLKTLLFVYLIVCFYGLYQAFFDFFDWEYRYLASGLTQEARILWEQEARRVFSTMNGAATLSVFLSTIAVLGLFFPKGKIKLGIFAKLKRYLYFLIMAVGAYYTISRGGWVCGIVAAVGYLCFKSKLLTISAYVGGTICLSAIIINAESIMESGYLARIEADAKEGVEDGEDVKDRALTTGTINGRLESFLALQDGDIWSPFGLKLAGREHAADSVFVHDILTDTLVRIGYIPCLLAMLLGVYIVIKLHKNIWDSKNLTHKVYLNLLVALTIGIGVGAVSSPSQLRTFPINTLFFLLIGLIITVFVIDKKQLVQSQED